ncbi:MAG: leucyl aminopeptidase [Elusimicrobia bacterium]|nr:leucyl aminopeptidase [Elusimicrobiota bacterium]
MTIIIECLDRSRFKGDKDTLVLFFWENEKFSAQGWMDAKKEKILEDIAKKENFKGKSGDLLVIHPEKDEPAGRLVLAGLGKTKEAKPEALREAAGKALKASLKQTENLWIDLPRWPDKIALSKLSQAAAEGALLASYRYAKHKTDDEAKKEPALKKVCLLVEKPEETAPAKEGVKKAEIFSQAVNFVRELVNDPPAKKRPADLAKTAKSLASNRVKVRVLGKKEIERLGMNALLGVNAGSSHEPVFVHCVFNPPAAPKKKICLVGKGITFDSGGLNIKTAGSLTPLTENMPGGNAYKPGDILRAMNGKTIEVLNTDAEGRLILADALAYAVKQNPDVIIDIATLTGAVLVALGDNVTGFLGNNEKLNADIAKASKETGEKIWQLPLVAEYKERIKGKVGDLTNISTKGSGSEPGAIIGGLFLEEFIDSKPWAHFDIAGTAWTDTETPTCPPGGTGAIVRTLLEYLLTP